MNPPPASITWNCSHPPTDVRSATSGANDPRFRSADTYRPVAADLIQIIWPIGAAARAVVAIINVVSANNNTLSRRVRRWLLRTVALCICFLLLILGIGTAITGRRIAH